jgi:hypothetical protein
MLANYAAIAAAGMVVILATGAFLILLPRGPGVEIGSWPLMMPFGLAGIVALWIVLRVVLLRSVAWTALVVVLSSLAFAYVLTAALCGPVACFQASPRYHMGWFIVGGAVLAALVHHLAYSSMQPGSPRA